MKLLSPLIPTKNLRQAFTLIELLVASSIFITVIVIAVGALFSAQAVNAKLQETQVILDGVNLATEVITRDIRYGSAFHCDAILSDPVPIQRKSCIYDGGIPDNGGGGVLVFKPSAKLGGTINANFDRAAFYLQNGIIYKKIFPYGAASTTYQVTASDVTITQLKFFVDGANTPVGGPEDVAGASDVKQPVVTLLLSGVTKPSKRSIQPIVFHIETTVSSRQLDN